MTRRVRIDRARYLALAVNSVCFVLFCQDDSHVCLAEELCRDEKVYDGGSVIKISLPPSVSLATDFEQLCAALMHRLFVQIVTGTGSP